MAIAGALFLYVLLIRTFDLANRFLMLDEQVRDWNGALRIVGLEIGRAHV